MFGGVVVLVRYDFARTKAKMLQKGFKPPLDLEEIAVLKIASYYCLSDGLSFSIKHGSQYIIGVSITGNQEEDRRAFARQLGHIVLGHFELYGMDLLDEERLSDHDRDILIQEADVFVEELLASTQRFQKVTRKSTGKEWVL